MRLIRQLILVIALALAFSATSAFGDIPQRDIPVDGSDLLRMRTPLKQLPYDQAKLGVRAQGEDYVHNGRPADFIFNLPSMDPANPDPEHLVPFWKEYSSVDGKADIYVAWNDLEAPPESPQQDQEVTQEDIEYLATEFDQRIWKSDVFHFGNYEPRAPADQPGYDGTHAGIFVYNIQDEAYFGDFPFYTVGYFWSSLNEDIDVNAIFIDSYNWKDRMTGDDAPPYLYPGTIAHEFEHLIHHDVDGDEEGFVDEGMADLAEQFIYGTVTTASHIGEYLWYHRDSLISWDGELADYGNAVLFQDYLWEQNGGQTLGTFGDPLADRVAENQDPFGETDSKFVDTGDAFIWNLIHEQGNGLDGLATMLGGPQAVEDTHHDFSLANLLDGRGVDEKYEYRNLELGGADSEFIRVEDGIADYANGRVRGNQPPRRYRTYKRADLDPWSVYYRTFQGTEGTGGLLKFYDAEAQSGVAPQEGSSAEWYSATGNMLERILTKKFTGVPENGKLSFMTWYDIEQDWDYGYVEASNDGTNWSLLTQTSSLPAAAEDINQSAAWDGVGGFTGTTAGWAKAEFDLADFSGDVYVRFRYMTDEAVNGKGWFVDNLDVAGVVEPMEAVGDWTTDGWILTDGMQQNDWTFDALVQHAKAGSTWWDLTPVVGPEGVGGGGEARVDTRYLKNGAVYAVVGNRPSGVFSAMSRLQYTKVK